MIQNEKNRMRAMKDKVEMYVNSFITEIKDQGNKFEMYVNAFKRDEIFRLHFLFFCNNESYWHPE